VRSVSVFVKLSKIVSSLFVTVHANMMYRHLFHAADIFCENQLKACSLNASVSHACWHIFVSKKRCKSLFRLVHSVMDCLCVAA